MRFILPILFAFFVAQIHAQQTLISSLVQPLTWEDTLRTNAEKFLKNSTPVFGYRFVIFGDFDGDQKPDTLVERFTDSTSTQEAPKYYYNSDTIYDYGDLVLLNMYLNPHSFIEWKKYDLKLDGGDLGFHYIENCGDINRDGKDEIVLVRQWSDWTNLNTAYIYTLHKNNWKQIYAIPIWEWQFPPTPSATMIPGMFGNFDFGIFEDDSLNEMVEQELQEFNFITYYPDHSIEFEGRNPIWENEKMMEKYQKLMEKGKFDIIYLDTLIYVRDAINPSILYRVEEIITEENKKEILFFYDDPAGMFTTRIYIDHPKSPFKK